MTEVALQPHGKSKGLYKTLAVLDRIWFLQNMSAISHSACFQVSMCIFFFFFYILDKLRTLRIEAHPSFYDCVHVIKCMHTSMHLLYEYTVQLSAFTHALPAGKLS